VALIAAVSGACDSVEWADGDAAGSGFGPSKASAEADRCGWTAGAGAAASAANRWWLKCGWLASKGRGRSDESTIGASSYEYASADRGKAAVAEAAEAEAEEEEEAEEELEAVALEAFGAGAPCLRCLCAASFVGSRNEDGHWSQRACIKPKRKVQHRTVRIA
jgi:hypothetical protein